MRGLQTETFILIFSILLLIEVISFLGLFQSIRHSGKNLKRFFSITYWIISIYILSLFTYTFSSPATVSKTTDYGFFNMIIVLVFMNLMPKLLLSLFTLIHWLIILFSKRRAKVFYNAGLILSLGVFLVMGNGMWFEKKQVRIENVELSYNNLPKSLDGLKIIQLSDVHLGSFYGNHTVVKKMQKLLAKENADLILFTGDMVNNFSYETDGYIDYFKNLKSKYGKFAITGNHDYGDYYEWPNIEVREENLKKIRRSINEMGFDLLLNENRKIAIEDTSIYVIGVENWGHDPFPQYADLQLAMENIPEQSFNILMSHDPAHWHAQIIPRTNIPLTLSGHTHGLQFGYLAGGIEFSLMYFIQKHWAGLYHSDNQYLYVNRGLGTIGFSGRIGMRPEITIITLQSK